MIDYLKSLALVAIALSSVLLANGCGDSDGGDYEYVALGASDATGIGAVPPTEGYVFLIDDALDECRADGSDLLNLGIPAAEIDEVEEIELPVAVDQGPDLVTLWPGPNDIISGTSVRSFEDDLNTILTELSQETSAVIVLANIPDLTRLPRFQEDPDPDVTRARISEFNAAIERQAAQCGCPIVNLAGLAISNTLVSEVDGFHPSNEGHETIANEFLSVIEPLACQ